MKYSLEESLCTPLSMDTSSKSMFIPLLVLSKMTFADALPDRAMSRDPFQMRSSALFPRSDFIDCSPKTNLNASATLDLPEPFGPTIPEIGAEKSSDVFFANDLNPASSRVFKYIH